MGTYCITCKNKECINHGKPICFNWGCEKYINNVFSNADHIREMTDEELSEFLWQFDLDKVAYDDKYPAYTRIKLLEWLQSPTTESNIKEN